MAFDVKDLSRDIVFQDELCGNLFTFHTTWGLFSPKEIDQGTKLLLSNLKVNTNDKILDLGCGYGPIGLALAKKATEGVTHMVDKDFVAVEFARKNAQLNDISNTKIYLSNAFSNVWEKDFDIVVSNLPAKGGKELLWIMLEGAQDHLKKGGSLYVVTVAGLKEFIKRNLETVFGNCEKLDQKKGYIVSRAIKQI